MAVLFITKIENNETKNEGLCLKCAKELGIPQVDTILSNMGISDDDLENMENDLEGLIASGGTEGEDSEDEHESRTPALDFSKIFGNLPIGPMPGRRKAAMNGKKIKKRTTKPPKRRRKTGNFSAITAAI